MDASLQVDEPSSIQITSMFNQLKSDFSETPYPSLKTRQQHLEQLKQVLLKYQDLLVKSVAQDFSHRSFHETKMLEILPAVENIKYTLKHLKKWMKPEKRRVSLSFQPGRAEVRHQPLGVVGIIVPWNYPIYLCLGPLIGALAAGNRVLIKLPEATPKTSSLLQLMLHECFPYGEVVAITGGPEVGANFSTIPFDHLLFTGSTQVGLKVMQAASEHLTPVTLELGGKSPSIIGRNYSIAAATQKIWSGKLLNAGQTCIAPDYVFIPKEKLEEFIRHSRLAVETLYPSDAYQQDYSCIIHEEHWQRLNKLIEEAQSSGVKIVYLKAQNKTDSRREFPPILVIDPPENIRLMQEEIFGPILPVKTYQIVEDALSYINMHPKPLALYYFDHDKANINYVLNHTHSGGVTINNTLIHIAQDDLPFGGVGQSGIGAYHAKEGFSTFSHQKSVFYQSKIDTTRILFPPFNNITDFVIKLMLRG